MKISSMAWCGVAGLGLFLLLGQLFADYPEIKFGVLRLVAILGIGLLIGAGINLLILRMDNPEANKDDVVNELAPFAVIAILIVLLMAIGGI